MYELDVSIRFWFQQANPAKIEILAMQMHLRVAHVERFFVQSCTSKNQTSERQHPVKRNDRLRSAVNVFSYEQWANDTMTYGPSYLLIFD